MDSQQFEKARKLVKESQIITVSGLADAIGIDKFLLNGILWRLGKKYGFTTERDKIKMSEDVKNALWEDLQKACTIHRVKGSKVVIYDANPYGHLIPERLIQFEKTVKTQLPRDYRDFLCQYNGGSPNPSYFWVKKIPLFKIGDGSELEQFLGLHDRMEYSIEDREGIPTSMIPIGEDGTGNRICMGIPPKKLGSIYFLDHELHPFDQPDSMEGITRLARNFSSFLGMLKESPE